MGGTYEAKGLRRGGCEIWDLQHTYLGEILGMLRLAGLRLIATQVVRSVRVEFGAGVVFGADVGFGGSLRGRSKLRQLASSK